MKSIHFTFFGLALILSTAAFNAHAALTIEITGGASLQIPVAIAPFAGEEAYPDKLSKIVMDDLARSGLFKLIDTSGIVPPRTPADVRVGVFSASLAISAQRVEVVSGAVAAGLEIAIVVAPGIFWHCLGPQIAVGPPVAHGRIVGFLDQRLEPLVARRIAEVVHPVEIERGSERLDVLPGRRHPRFVHPAQNLGRNQCGENRDDHQHDHDLDQRETGFAA